MNAFHSHDIPVESVSLSIPTDDPFQGFDYVIQIFPLGQDHFSQTDICHISSVLGDLSTNGPYDFVIGNNYGN